MSHSIYALPNGTRISVADELDPIPEGSAFIRKAVYPASYAQYLIDELERKQGRALREAVLGDAAALERLRQIDAEINALRRDIP